MAKILVADGMDKTAADTLTNLGHSLNQTHYEVPDLKKEITKHDVIIVRSATKVTKEVIDAALTTGRLKLIVRAGVGVDNIDVAYAKQNGIAVRNTPAASSASVAELTIGHMFTLARHLHSANITMRNGKWNKKQYKGIELAGKTLGLIGFGRIAKATAQKAHALGMKILYTNRSGKKPEFADYCYAPLDELLSKADFISLHLPYNSATGAVIGKAQFDSMKDGAYLINCARGGVVDESALLDALNNGKLSAAAMDVFEQEPTTNIALIAHPHVSVTPHIGGSTKEAQSRIGQEIIEIVKEYF